MSGAGSFVAGVRGDRSVRGCRRLRSGRRGRRRRVTRERVAGACLRRQAGDEVARVAPRAGAGATEATEPADAASRRERRPERFRRRGRRCRPLPLRPRAQQRSRRRDRDLRRGGAAGEGGLERREQRAQVSERAQAAPGRPRLLAQELGERASAAEDEGLDRGTADTELRRDLVVGEPAPVAQQDRAALLLGELARGRPRARSAPRPGPGARRVPGRARPGRTETRGGCAGRRTPSAARQTLRAIPSSQAISVAGTTPRRRPRTAWRNVVWTASSASSRLPRRERQ